MKIDYLIFSLLTFLGLSYFSKFQETNSEINLQFGVTDSLKSITLPLLSPEQSRLAFRVPEGYHMELVASEPMITEPAALS